MSKILIVSLEYLEDDWQQTKACIEATGLPVVYVSRDGVGNMARAFNYANILEIEYSTCGRLTTCPYDYLWFVTNIVFYKEIPQKLAEAMQGFAAIHPAMKSSDHIHQHPDGSGEVKEVPFIEWTAPMVRADVFLNNPLDENLPYWYFDLLFSKQVKDKGYKLGVHHGAEVNHTYLRNAKQHPISKIRSELRNYWANPSQQYLVKMFGENWKQILNWK